MRKLLSLFGILMVSLTGCFSPLQEAPVEEARIHLVCPECVTEWVGYAPLTVTVFAEYPEEALHYAWAIRHPDGTGEALDGRVVVLRLTEPGTYEVQLRAVYEDGYVITGRTYIYVLTPREKPVSTTTVRVSDRDGALLAECVISAPVRVMLNTQFLIHVTCQNASHEKADVIYIMILADEHLLETGKDVDYDRPFYRVPSRGIVEVSAPYKALSEGESVLRVDVHTATGKLGGDGTTRIRILIGGE